MEDPTVIEQPDADSGSFPFSNFCAHGQKQSLNIGPLDIGADRTVENQIERFMVFFLHVFMVLNYGTVSSSKVMMRSDFY